MTPQELEFMDKSILYFAFDMDTAQSDFDFEIAKNAYEAMQLMRKVFTGEMLEVYPDKKRHLKKVEQGLLSGRLAVIGKMAVPNTPMVRQVWEDFQRISGEIPR